MPQVLLVAKNPAGIARLAEYLQRLGCECRIATSGQEVRQLSQTDSFDLVLSELALPDGSAYRLIGMLLGSKSTLFIAVPFHHSCVWLPAVDHGEHCLGKSALKPSEFLDVLCRLLQEKMLARSTDAKPRVHCGSSSQAARPQTIDAVEASLRGPAALVLCGGGRAERYLNERDDPKERR